MCVERIRLREGISLHESVQTSGMKNPYEGRLPVVQHKEVRCMQQDMNKANNQKKNANQNEQNQQGQQNNSAKPGNQNR